MARRPVDARGRFTLGREAVPLGCEAVPLGREAVSLGREAVSLGREAVPLLAMLAMLAILPACGSGGRALHPICLYNGTHYTFGDSFPSTDGCATCSCSMGGVICGHRTCPPDAGGGDVASADAASDVAAIDAAAIDVARPADARSDGTGMADTGVAPPDSAPPTCVLDRAYRFRNDGGRVAYADSSTLNPPRTHVVARDHFVNALPRQCARELPCNVPALVDMAAIQRALAHPDVVAALAMATPPFYGVDTRPSDGQVFIFERADGRGFTAGSGASVPAGIRALADLLLTLQVETAATPMCAGL